jgi:hypothetical protein
MSIEAMKQALEALGEKFTSGNSIEVERATITRDEYLALRQAIEQAEKQSHMRLPKEGDRVICIEDETIGTVQFTTASGEPYIKFDDCSYGTWTLEQFSSGFRYVEQAEKQEPVAYLYHDTACAELANPLADSTLLVLACGRKPNGRNETPLYTAPPRKEWVRLTELEIAHGLEKANLPAIFSYRAAARAGIDAFKEKNT